MTAVQFDNYYVLRSKCKNKLLRNIGNGEVFSFLMRLHYYSI